jgi:hypothetical protein
VHDAYVVVGDEGERATPACRGSVEHDRAGFGDGERSR